MNCPSHARPSREPHTASCNTASTHAVGEDRQHRRRRPLRRLQQAAKNTCFAACCRIAGSGSWTWSGAGFGRLLQQVDDRNIPFPSGHHECILPMVSSLFAPAARRKLAISRLPFALAQIKAVFLSMPMASTFVPRQMFLDVLVPPRKAGTATRLRVEASYQNRAF